MDLNIRKLSVVDIMPMVNVLNKMDYKKIMATLDASKIVNAEKAAKLTPEQKADDAVALQFGVEMILPVVGVILEDLPKCEKPLYAWLSSMCGVDKDTFLALGPAVVPEALYEIVHQEEFGDFFKAVSKFLA